MKIDPNTAIETKAEHILCQVIGVELYTGEVVAAEDLDNEDGPFIKFCSSLDPNICYISAYVPDHAADEVFFKARETAKKMGVHMQANIERPERQAVYWKNYKKLKVDKPQS